MYNEEPATLQMEVQLSVQGFQTSPDQEWLPKAPEDLESYQDSSVTLQEVLVRYQKREHLFNLLRKRMHSCDQLEALLQFVLPQVQQLLQTDWIIIYRFHPSGGQIAFDSVGKPLKPLTDLDIENTRPRETLITTSKNLFSPIPNPLQITANLAVPILLNTENQLWGLLIVHDCRHSRQWERWEIESLEQISLEIAIAIQQSQLSQQVQQQREQRQLDEIQAQQTSQQLNITLEALQSTQKQLLQNEKMANVGQIVADMAKEINNPINFIYANLQPASQYAEDLIKVIELYQYYYPTPTAVIASHLQKLDLGFLKTDLLKLMWSMRSGSDRLKEIVFALQNFSSLDEGKMKKANLHQGINSVLVILQHRLKPQPNRFGIEVIKDFGELPLVECYPGELNHVFMNILNNAIDALEERMQYDESFIPKIRIFTKIVRNHLSLVSSDEIINIGKGLNENCKIIIHISDNGKGMLPHVKRHVFEPFFTTKTVDKAKGIGLSISHKIIVEKHKGNLKCNSKIGQGTEFIIEMNTRVKRYANSRNMASF
ncbi:MAG: ATP-binding protein [Gloeotrichia echinulata HAB0833]